MLATRSGRKCEGAEGGGGCRRARRRRISDVAKLYGLTETDESAGLDLEILRTGGRGPRPNTSP